jgi:manganese/zinc/iron transport system permease protein
VSYTQEALLACALLGLLSGFLGNFLLVRKMALVGDMLGHAVLPGVGVGFILAAYQKRFEYIFLGALAAAFLANMLHEFLAGKFRIKEDASLAINLTGFYALGITLLSWIQSHGGAAQSGLDRFMLGQASSLGREDIRFLAVMILIVGLVIALFYKEIKSACFDTNFSLAAGLRPKLFQALLSAMIAATVIVSLQAVGVVLSCAFLIIPASTAFFFSRVLEWRLLLGSLFGMLAGTGGAWLSLEFEKTPTGPAIILLSTTLFAVAALMGREHSWLRRQWSQYREEKIRLRQDLLRCAYYFWELDGANKPISKDGIFKRTELSSRALFDRIHKSLVAGGFLKEVDAAHVVFTEKGLGASMEMVRRHRLWELYLVQKLRFPLERVHENAERMEHIMTSEIVEHIAATLENPVVDPHGKSIPSYKELRKWGVPGY